MLKDFITALSWRYATKIYNPKKKVSKATLEKLLEAIRLAPSSFGLQPYRVLVIENPKLKQKIHDKACDQRKVIEAPYLLVFCTPTAFTREFIDGFIDIFKKARGQSEAEVAKLRQARRKFFSQTSRKDLDVWAGDQCFIALGFLISAAALARVDAGPMGGFKPKELDKLLDLKRYGLRSRVLCALGYRSEEDQLQYKKKVRWPKDKMFIRF